MIDENALLTARVEAAKVASSLADNFVEFKEVYDFTRKEFEDALRLVEKGARIAQDGKLYICIEGKGPKTRIS